MTMRDRIQRLCVAVFVVGVAGWLLWYLAGAPGTSIGIQWYHVAGLAGLPAGLAHDFWHCRKHPEDCPVC